MTERRHPAAHWALCLFLALLVGGALASCGGGGGGFSADGGVSGSGISSVTGNVTAVTGVNGNLGGIRVLVQGTDIETVTADDGSFTLTGEFDGAVTVVFELDDGGRASTRVDVPTGGSVDLQDVTLDPDQEEARPSRRAIAFSGVVRAVDCQAATMVAATGRDGARTRFTVRLEGAFVHDSAGRPVTCTGIRLGDETTVQGEVLEDDSVDASDVEIRRRPPTATPTPVARPTLTPASDDPAPERTLDAPRATIDRPAATSTPRDSDRPGPAPTVTTNDGDRPRPAPIATPHSGLQPAPRP